MFLIVNYCFEHHFWLVSFFGTNEIGCVYDENTFAQICKSFKYIFVEHLEKLALYVMKVKIWHWWPYPTFAVLLGSLVFVLELSGFSNVLTSIVPGECYSRNASTSVHWIFLIYVFIRSWNTEDLVGTRKYKINTTQYRVTVVALVHAWAKLVINQLSTAYDNSVITEMTSALNHLD